MGSDEEDIHPVKKAKAQAEDEDDDEEEMPGQYKSKGTSASEDSSSSWTHASTEEKGKVLCASTAWCYYIHD